MNIITTRFANALYDLFCCFLKTYHGFISLSWKSLFNFYVYVIDIWKRTSRNTFSWLDEPVSVFSLKCVRITFRLAQSSFYLSYIYKEKFREFSFLALPCWYDRYTAIFSRNWLALRITGGSEEFVLQRAERQGFSRTPDSLTDAAVLNLVWYMEGNSQRMIAWQQELIWWFGGRYYTLTSQIRPLG